MKKLNVKDLIHKDLDWILNLPPDVYQIKMADGAFNTTRQRLAVSWFFWQLFKEYPGGLPTSQCLFRLHYREDKPDRIDVSKSSFSSGVHLRLVAACLWGAYFGMKNPKKGVQWDMSKRAYELTNQLYNFHCTHLGAYVNTLDFGDIYDLVRHPVIAKIKKQCTDGKISIDEAYDKMFEHIHSNDPTLWDNEIRKGVVCKVLDRRSIAQTLGPRGFVKDIDGDSFHIPIDVGYAEGLRSLYDHMIESCSAKRALYMQYGPLEETEYTNRQVQLHCATVRAIEGRDCGTKHTLKWTVRPYDLKNLIGNNYVTNKGTVKMIMPEDTHLIGKTLRIRNGTLCNNRDSTTICETCFGHNHLVIPPGDNVGHVLTIGPQSQISQKVLSTKHVEISVEAIVLKLDSLSKQVLKRSKHNKWFTDFKKPTYKNGYYVLKFSSKEAPNITTVKSDVEIEDLSPTRISQVHHIEVVAYDGNDNEKGRVAIPTSVGNVGSSFTLDFLQYLRDYGWKQVDGVVEVNLSDWEYEKSFLQSRRRNKDIMQFHYAFKDFIFGKPKSGQRMGQTSVDITDFKSPSAALVHLMDLLDPPPDAEDAGNRISINLSEASVYVKAAMARNPRELDYQLPRAGEPFQFITVPTGISNRSVGGMLAYESQRSILTQPESFLNTERPPHPLDWMIG